MRQRTRLARELQFCLLNVIRVKMQVAKRVDEFARLQAADLREPSARAMRSWRCLKGTPEKYPRCAGKAGSSTRRRSHKTGTRRGTAGKAIAPISPGFQGGDDEPAAVGILFDLRDHVINLVDAAAVGGAPVRPLRAIDAAEVAVGVRPFVPDGHAVRVERFSRSCRRAETRAVRA